MDRPLAPRQTPAARRWLSEQARTENIAFGALLATVDGHRNVVELESFARALGLDASALERLRNQGFIEIGDGPSTASPGR